MPQEISVLSFPFLSLQHSRTTNQEDDNYAGRNTVGTVSVLNVSQKSKWCPQLCLCGAGRQAFKLKTDRQPSTSLPHSTPASNSPSIRRCPIAPTMLSPPMLGDLGLNSPETSQFNYPFPQDTHSYLQHSEFSLCSVSTTSSGSTLPITTQSGGGYPLISASISPTMMPGHQASLSEYSLLSPVPRLRPLQ